MTRRRFTAYALAVSIPVSADEAAPVTLRGKLTQKEGQPPSLSMSDGKSVPVEGDDQTAGVLRDARLKDVEFEVTGHYLPNGSFRILPIHKRAMFAHQNGKRLFVTYWCAVCAIRTYTPGICWCCQDETALDLLEKLDN